MNEFCTKLNRNRQRRVMSRENPTADPFARLEHGELDARFAQHVRRGEAGDTGADDHYVNRCVLHVG